MKKHNNFYKDEQTEIQSFVKILIGLIVIIGLFYLLTVFVLNKEEPYKRTDNPGTINYNSMYLGTLLNKIDSEYYVLVFDSQDKSNSYIINRSSSYASKANSLPLYTADLALEFNKKFIADESSYKVDDVVNLKVKGTTLILVKNGKISKFIEDNEKIIAELN